MKPALASLQQVMAQVDRQAMLDRHGYPLAVSYRNPWNTSDVVELSEAPSFLRQALILAEDKRFWQHHGIDWRARVSAVWQTLKTRHYVRGASTITEQVVRMLHPRPRTLWSRWIEGFEAYALEQHLSKEQILAFYLNQVPYAANRRGIVQAARYYFNRDLNTLNRKEILAIAVLPRAPSSLDLYRSSEKIIPAIERLAIILKQKNVVDEVNYQAILSEPMVLQVAQLPMQAAHFVQYARRALPQSMAWQKRIYTTLDGHLQNQAQAILDERMRALRKKQVYNAALLVVDHQRGEVLAWVVAGSEAQKTPYHQIDAVLTPRQPGSALKPFLYAMALEKGWSPITTIDDSPFADNIGHGLHRFNNYSHVFYGKVSLREALGNSLNIPALHTIQYVGIADYLQKLRQLGFTTLDESADFYDEGLALGNGAVSLYELVQAYTALAHQGQWRPLRLWRDTAEASMRETRVYTIEASSLIGNILSDPFARRFEFGRYSVLNLPVQTAVKTGTSNDYRDAWALGFNHRYVVGVWMGNLDQKPTEGLTGATGPALVLRSVFALLNQQNMTEPLYLSPRLVAHKVCTQTEVRGPCLERMEYFVSGTEPSALPTVKKRSRVASLAIERPSEGLMLAWDPRIPADKQAFEFIAIGVEPNESVEWWLNDKRVATTRGSRYLWPLQRGRHTLSIRVSRQQKTHVSMPVHFIVK